MYFFHLGGFSILMMVRERVLDENFVLKSKNLTFVSKNVIL